MNKYRTPPCKDGKQWINMHINKETDESVTQYCIPPCKGGKERINTHMNT